MYKSPWNQFNNISLIFKYPIKKGKVLELAKKSGELMGTSCLK